MERKLLTFVGLLVSMLLTAAPVTKDAARQKALQFLTERGSGVAASRSVQPIELQLCDGVATDLLHVFNVGQQEGFVIISGDDATIPILGFSDSGSIDPNNMPPNMKAWLLGYADQIKWIQEHGNTAKAQTTAPKKAPKREPESSPWTPGNAKADIGALLKTTWNQGAPYCYQCPGIETSFCVTGCVATAMAQVMNYHQWPTSEIAVIPNYLWSKYTTYKNDGKNHGPGAYGPKTIDWTNMKANYTGEESSTDVHAIAVATLMRCCGQSIEMNYWTNGSEAQTYKVANALKTYFGYSTTTTKYVSRSYYSYANWIDLIYNELSQGRPVIYGGQAVDNGHTFVCDGYQYQEGDKFHINWGWGGQCDGYFALSALTPEVQGIGGSSSGSSYTFGHEAIVGIQKSSGTGTVLEDVANTVNMTINSISLNRNNIGLGETIEITVNVTNNSSDAYDGDIVFAVNGNIAYGANVTVPANTTKSCVINYMPLFIGTATIQPLIADGAGGYATDNANIKATLSVGDAMPYNLTASNITNTTAEIGWTSVEEGTKWNVRSRQLSITEVNFNDGLPTNWTDHSQNSNYWIFTPTIKLGGSISFWAGGEDLSGDFRLYINTGEGYSSISQSFTVSDTPQHYTVDLSGYSGTTNLAFILTNTDGNTVALNDVTIIEPATDWVIVEDVTTNPYTLTGLTWERNYEVQVQAVLNEATTGWSESVIFSTPRITPTDLAAVPTNQSALISWTGYTDSYKVKYRTAATEAFVDDFENYSPNAWTQNSGEIYNFTNESNHFVMLGYGSRVTQYLITPKLDSYGSGSTVEFKQRYYQNGTTFKVGFSSTTADIEAFTWGNEQQAANTFTLYSEVIPAGTRYIAIQTTAAADGNALIIDDVNIGTTTSAGEWNIVTPAVSPLNISGLSAFTDYEYQIDGINGGEEIFTSATASFTTTSSNAFELANDDSEAETNNAELIAAWNGMAANVTLAGRTLLGDNQWNTMCLPFDISTTTLTIYLTTIIGSAPTVTCKVLDKGNTSLSNDGDLTLAFTNAENIPAGTPFIIKFNTAANVDLSSHFLSVTIDGSSTAIERMTQTSGNVKFVGQWSSFDITNDNIDEIIYVASGNKIGYSSKARTLKALRAHFWVQSNSAAVRSIILDLGDDDVTSIDLVNGGTTTRQSSGWYSLDGRRLQSEPTEKGVYIVNGKKVIK